MSWSRQGKTQEFFDKFKAGLRRHKAPIRANRFRFQNWTPLFLNRDSGHDISLRIANHLFEAIRTNRLSIMKKKCFLCESIRANRSDLCCESPGHLRTWNCYSAHPNRSDCCDLRLRCPSRPQKLLAISETSHCDLRVRWKIYFELRFPRPKPLLLLDFWRFGSVNAEIASDCNCAILVR